MQPMSRLISATLIVLLAFSCARLNAAQLGDGVASKHVLMRMPLERVSMGREMIANLERCYLFMNRSTENNLPKKVLITVTWEQSGSVCNWKEGAISVGMKQPASSDLKASLFHSVAREMARLGLLRLSGGAQREDTQFLFEGMIELLTHEFEHSSRSLEAAWALCKHLDENRQLGLMAQRPWSSFSGGETSLRTVAPGVTFLTTFRELQGRDQPMKLFGALKKNSSVAALSSVFRNAPTDLDSLWLKRVREHEDVDEITIPGDDPPQLLELAPHADSSRPGGVLQLRLLLTDRNENLLPSGVFVHDLRTGRLLTITESSRAADTRLTAALPIASDCPPGDYSYQVTAIDEGGNLRRWVRPYTVASK